MNKREVQAACGVAAVGLVLSAAAWQWWIPLAAYAALVCGIVIKAVSRVIARRIEALVKGAVQEALKRANKSE